MWTFRRYCMERDKVRHMEGTVQEHNTFLREHLTKPAEPWTTSVLIGSVLRSDRPPRSSSSMRYQRGVVFRLISMCVHFFYTFRCSRKTLRHGVRTGLIYNDFPRKS